MRIKIMILTILLIIGFLIVIFVVKNNNNNKNIKEINKFHFSYITSYMMDANVSYDIVKKEGKYISYIKLIGEKEENKKTVEVSKFNMQKLIDILNKYEVIKWNGFKKSDNRVLDGLSFDMYMTVNSDYYVTASGYMKWPKNYKEVRDELDKYFTSLIEK